MKKSMLVAALAALVAASSVMAGWQDVRFTTPGNDTVYYKVNTKVGQDFFTIMKSVSSYRVYITFQGVGYEQFKNSVTSWKAATKPNASDSDVAKGFMSTVTLTDATFGDANGNITFGVFLADCFSEDGKIPKLSVVVMPNPAFNAHSGGTPNVTIQANNCNVAGVKVIYAPRPADASGSQQAPVGVVSVNTGTIDSSVNTFPGRNYGNVGTIHVQGGLFGNCNIRGNVGTLFSEGRICTIKPGGTPQKVIQGGSLGGVLITAGGNIGTISARNGLFGDGGDADKKRIVSGYAATPKLYGASANIGQIVVKRGWEKPCVVAGSAFDGKFASKAPEFYNGGIKMFRVNNKGDGTYTSQTGGVFTSAVAPRVVGKQKSAVSGNTIYVQRWGKEDLSTFVK